MEDVAKAALGAVLGAAFGVPCDISSIEAPPGGANSATHRLVRTQQGEIYSVKISTRMAASGGDRNEYLANTLAKLVGMPGASDARKLASASMLGATFGDRGAIAVRWAMTGAVQITACRESIGSNRDSFLEQLGCWAVFNTMIGVTDRGAQNIIWNTRTATLAHIDFEDAFRGVDNLQEQLQMAKDYGGLDGNAWRADAAYPLGEAVARGMRQGSELLLRRREALRVAMESEGVDPTVVAKAMTWVDLPAEEKVARARASVG